MATAPRQATGRIGFVTGERSAPLPILNGVRATRLALPDGTWPLLLDYLVLRFYPIPRIEIAQRMQRGEIVDSAGSPIKPDTPFARHTSVFYYRTVATEDRIPFEESILFQDDELIVADKPHFLPVTPTGRYLQETLLVRLIRKLNLPHLTPIHRLDRDTAGVMLFSINPETRRVYQDLFRQRVVTKVYEAIAPYRPELSFPTLRQSRLVAGTPFMRMQEAPPDDSKNANAQTFINILEFDADSALARYELRPVTGKKHQLRVHMAALGIPIRHDPLYPQALPASATAQDRYTAPLQLLARMITFTDPLTGIERRFHSSRQLDWPLPQSR
jgi:tRNA pseudouridine32 synthase/23S rRNA pseudouridine746 synthase